MKIFVDTNVLASALVARGLCADLFEAILESHEMLVSEWVLNELQRVLPDKLGQTTAITNKYIELLRAEALVLPDSELKSKLPDPDDEAILAAAIVGSADLFVTGDKALLAVSQVEGLPIVSPRELWQRLAAA